MSEPATAASHGWWQTLIIAGAAAALTFAAGLVMFSAFMYYDDEGYVLISLKNFAEHGGLYRDVFSQYGPFPFVLHYGLHALGLPFTHVAGRLLTLAAWTGTAVGCAALVRQATRSFVLSLAVLAALFPYLWVMVSEPSHPGALIALMVTLVAALGYRWIVQGRINAWACAAGITAAALALTKINVGAFVVLSALAWILLHHEHATVRRWATVVLAAGAMLVPLALMKSMLGVEWVRSFALVFACSAMATVLTNALAAPSRTSWRTLGWSIASGTAIAALVVAVVCLRGTTVRDLLEGIFLAPLRHPGAFNLGFRWAAGADVLAVLSLLGCIAACVARRRGFAAVDVVIAVARVAASIGAVFVLLKFPNASPDRSLFGYAAPCAWLFLWPLAGEDPARRSALGWVVLLALGQMLHAFPVAGSQIAWGTFLALPIAAVGGHDAANWLADRFASTLAGGRRAAAHVVQISLAVFAAVLGLRFAQVGTRYQQGSDLALPGAEFLRLPTEATALFRLLALNATAHADMVFTEPGMFSFNLWTGLPTPTLANVTHWFSLLDAPRQEAIIRGLEAHPRACIIRQRDHIAYLNRRNFAPAGPLHDYIAQHFSPAFVLDDFEFCVRNGRRIEPLLLGEMQVVSDTPDTENTALVLRLLLPSGRKVTRIELTSTQPGDKARLVFDGSNTRLETAPVTPSGTGATAAKPTAWPLQLEGPATVVVHFNRFIQPRPTAGSLITFLAADGTEVALARLKQH